MKVNKELLFNSRINLNESMCDFNKALIPEGKLDGKIKRSVNKGYVTLMKVVEKWLS